MNSIDIRWIFDCVRQFPEAAQETAELALEFRGEGVVGLGLAGDETAADSREFEDVFAFARAHELYVHVHAGEIGEPQSVWDAIKILGANRIGHGIQAARDQVLMSYLKDHAIGLDICLTSNARTGAWTPISKNPFWIFDCVRQFGPEAAQETAELALEFRGEGVVGLGLAGDETAADSREFEDVFAFARAHELYVHVHAGEIGEPQSVWDAIKILGANRIGHGIQAARDQVLMSYLKDHAIGLDICLTSNARTGAWTPISKNPFWLLYKRGVPVTLSTDDPGLFDTTLLQEYAQAIKYFELAESDLAYIALQSVRSSFLPHTERMKLMQEFQNSIHELTA